MEKGRQLFHHTEVNGSVFIQAGYWSLQCFHKNQKIIDIKLAFSKRTAETLLSAKKLDKRRNWKSWRKVHPKLLLPGEPPISRNVIHSKDPSEIMI